MVFSYLENLSHSLSRTDESLTKSNAKLYGVQNFGDARRGNCRTDKRKVAEPFS